MRIVLQVAAVTAAVAVLTLVAWLMRDRDASRPPSGGKPNPAAVPGPPPPSVAPQPGRQAVAAPGEPPAPAMSDAAATLESELALIRRTVEGIRRGNQDPRVQRAWIEQFCKSRIGVFAQIFARDPDDAARWLDTTLGESDPDLRVPMGQLLRSSAGAVRDRLLTLAGGAGWMRDVGLAALGSATDEKEHQALAVAVRAADTEEARVLALESIASEPERYDPWQGRAAGEETIRGALEGDASPRVRASAAIAYLTFVPPTPERAAYIRARLANETDRTVIALLRPAVMEPKSED